MDTNEPGGIRPATPSDLDVIRPWLEGEARNGKGFIHNWHLIVEAQVEGRMVVFDAASDAGVVGFLTQGISRSSILQVRSEHQGRGIGRALAEDGIASEVAQGNVIQVVQCADESSIGFWRRMGFVPSREQRPHELRSALYVHHVSPLEHPEVKHAEDHMVIVRVYPENALSDERFSVPDRVHYAGAEYLEGCRRLLLDHRIGIVNEEVLRDVVVEVWWGGLSLFFDKVKRDSAADIGFEQCPNNAGWFIDEVEIPESKVDGRRWSTKR